MTETSLRTFIVTFLSRNKTSKRVVVVIAIKTPFSRKNQRVLINENYLNSDAKTIDYITN